jgi:hypothetical protein
VQARTRVRIRFKSSPANDPRPPDRREPGKKGYSARVVEGSNPSSARVRVFGYRTKTDASKAAQRLKQEEHLTPWVQKVD